LKPFLQMASRVGSALAATLRLPHFHVFGVSGGGPYALACASELASTLLFEFAAKHPRVARACDTGGFRQGVA
jgi:hypothetical protein